MAEAFTFIKVLLASSVISHSQAEKLVLKKIRLFVADSADKIEAPELLIGAPILQHLRVHT